jgi:signal transduction histidine kinase
LVLDTARITLDLMFEPNLPLVLVDLHLMRRTLSNLIDNAIKFTPERGHVRVWARRGRERAPGAILVGVSDSGPGILPEDQERLFRMYERSGSAAKRKPGSGVGLAFCKLAVEAHGERIWVESVPGKGSSFLLTMAIADDVGGPG